MENGSENKRINARKIRNKVIVKRTNIFNNSYSEIDLRRIKMDAENQITKEDISMTGFSIVAYSGDARTYLMQAMDKASEGKITEAKELVKKAEESINLAHNEQTKLLSKEAGGDDMDVTFIMVHGQDTLMTTMLLKDQMKTIINLYERVNKLEGNSIE